MPNFIFSWALVKEIWSRLAKNFPIFQKFQWKITVVVTKFLASFWHILPTNFLLIKYYSPEVALYLKGSNFRAISRLSPRMRGNYYQSYAQSWDAQKFIQCFCKISARGFSKLHFKNVWKLIHANHIFSASSKVNTRENIYLNVICFKCKSSC